MESNWRKSSYSGDNGGACVEVASADVVLVRDTTDRHGPSAEFAPTRGGPSSRPSSDFLSIDPLTAHSQRPV